PARSGRNRISGGPPPDPPTAGAQEVNTARHSSSSTGPITSTGYGAAAITSAQRSVRPGEGSPARMAGIDAPNTTRVTPAQAIAAEHMAHGSPLAYMVAPVRPGGAGRAARTAFSSAWEVGSPSETVALRPSASTRPSSPTSTAP